MSRLSLMLLLLAIAGSAYGDYQLRFDPFEKPASARASSPSYSSPESSSIELRGVILDGRRSLANINGNFVRLNGEVAGYTVTRIERDRVVLMKNSITTILTVKKNER